jgi:hypothetical protein
MSETSCPSCDAPAPAAARKCARCGYRFVEDGGRAFRAPPLSLLAAGGLVAIVAALALALTGGGDEEVTANSPARLQVVSERPLSTPAAERLLEQRYTALSDDDSTAVSCSEREAKPAHSVRRCSVRYRNGNERRVVLLTNARGNEVLSKP